MCFGSLIIAVTPTYATIGIAAPAHAGAGAHHRGAEPRRRVRRQRHVPHARSRDPKHRGFYSSFQYVTLIGGQLTAIIVLLLLQKVFLTPEQLKAWGWRIPFVIGAAARDLRRCHAAQPARDGSVRGSASKQQADAVDPSGAVADIRARCCWWSASPPAAPPRSIPTPPTCRTSSNCPLASPRIRPRP